MDTERTRKKPQKHPERVYVKVNSDFDAAGYIKPVSVTWKDGRIFRIEEVLSFRPASSVMPWEPDAGIKGDCYTVKILGQTKQLFFERCDPRFDCLFGRWFVRILTPETTD